MAQIPNTYANVQDIIPLRVSPKSETSTLSTYANIHDTISQTTSQNPDSQLFFLESTYANVAELPKAQKAIKSVPTASTYANFNEVQSQLPKPTPTPTPTAANTYTNFNEFLSKETAEPQPKDIKIMTPADFKKKYTSVSLLTENKSTNVKLYRAKMNNSDVIIKEYPADYNISNINQEINNNEKIGKNCEKFSLTCFIESFKKDNKINIVTTYHKNYITLKEYITTTSQNERCRNAYKIISKIIACVEGLHSLGIAHRDLNNTNVMINKDNLDIKIIDFGNACSQPCNTLPGDKMFLPVENILKGEYYGFLPGLSMDTWSTGILFFDLLTGTTTAELFCKKETKKTCDDNTTRTEFLKAMKNTPTQFEDQIHKEVANIDTLLTPQDKKILNDQPWSNFSEVITYKDLLNKLLNKSSSRQLPNITGGYYAKYMKYKFKYLHHRSN
ncbi:MAG: putative serine/threonine-protein kinase pim-2-like protein [Harvfovirus sp.]|uniref:Putative serine/threonine-protein kinase pim-2-like protein n=1 Tax=Harvfovirus sp. TaxID=2487768 RepID=A0A3G5A5N5_9VIRU|nr:MAG: putative serine/threonine-protein kinase pim-2-like protein [Harvfovirus sp.]